MNLLYRGSLHGFRSSKFHDKCDNIPKTLTIIKATNGNIFGGYTEVTWNSEEDFKRDEEAFIFILINMENNPVKVKIAEEMEDYAIWCSSSSGPLFGCDICIEENFSREPNYSEFGIDYILENYPEGSEKAQNFLAGSYKFTIEEIEVFQLE